jgi:hypothetical protein
LNPSLVLLEVNLSVPTDFGWPIWSDFAEKTNDKSHLKNCRIKRITFVACFRD